jgi:hypothetical protein
LIVVRLGHLIELGIGDFHSLGPNGRQTIDHRLEGPLTRLMCPILSKEGASR